MKTKIASVVLAAGLAASCAALGWMHGKIRAFEEKHGGDVYANLSKTELDERIRSAIAAEAEPGRRDPRTDPARTPEQPAAEEPEQPADAAPKPIRPYVKFADKGRYLPPAGNRSLAVESVNVTGVWTRVSRVEPRNLVTLLALEENAYGHRHGRAADAESTEDFATADAVERVFACDAAPDTRGMTELPVGGEGPANGLFLVSIRDAGRPRRDWAWDDDDVLNPLRCRVVCVSDLALSVRRSGTEAPGVWVTSLTTGRPVAGASVEIYSTANVKVMEGVTDAHGWCVPDRTAKGDPFAVVVYAADAADMTFLALRTSAAVDETHPDGARDPYLAPDDVEAFVWTDRGIYRHDEPIFAQVLLRNGARRAPAPLPVELELRGPADRLLLKRTLVSDAEGSAIVDGLAVPADQPSGSWTLVVKAPGAGGRVFGRRQVKIEEFAPPQIRVGVKAAANLLPADFAFIVTGEHLFGGAAHGLRCEGAVVFEDAPFAPAGWNGWRFGNAFRALKPAFRRLGAKTLGRDGEVGFFAPLFKETGLPAAAVRVTAQGTVFEDGGRPATSRFSATLHHYPYYIGSDLPDWIRSDGGRPKMSVACVGRDGVRLAWPKSLRLTLKRTEWISVYHENRNGTGSWESQRVVKPVVSDLPVETRADGVTEVELPVDGCGDYTVELADPETEVSYAHSFYLGEWGDETVRTSLAEPTKVALTPDRPFYRVGEIPRLTVRAPFAGTALLTVMREGIVRSEVLELTNATAQIELPVVTEAMAPGLDVSLAVVQGVTASARHLAVRAHGETTLAVRPAGDEIGVSLAAEVADARELSVSLTATGATAAVVTVVDEGINLLTDERTPDPLGWFARLRDGDHPLYDLYSRILPVRGADGLAASGVKTGGGFGAELLGRVSPVPTRRFKPLALWSGRLPVVDGRGETKIALPPFVGEVRVTAVAWSASATGSAAVRRKVSPKLVIEPDAPRFVAPGDEYEVTLPIFNRSGAPAELGYEVSADGAAVGRCGLLALADGASTNVRIRVKAPAEPGEVKLAYHVRGAGEVHDREILLPVRPAVAGRGTAGVRRLAPGEKFVPEKGNFVFREYDSPLAELAGALNWLAEYPHGCLEQTASRIFPLVAAGGILGSANSLSNANACVAAGVKRVESMIRSNDFVMWPDCSYAPWDPEVSLYAAHFLVEAERSGEPLLPAAKTQVSRFLRRWAMSTNDTVSAYACHDLALAGEPERDRMLRLYDGRAALSLVSRARLARAFALTGDRTRAEALLADAERPGSVVEAAFSVLALIEIDPDDARIPPLVERLLADRDRARLAWGTTSENAHALLAIGEYYRHHPPAAGGRYVAWRKVTVPRPDEVKPEAEGIAITRRFLTPEGDEADLSGLRRGEMLLVELTLTVDADRTLSDLVIEDLLPAAFEPADGSALKGRPVTGPDWVMRSDARDDRMLVFSKRFTLERGAKAGFTYPVRVVSGGVFTLPGVSVEAMYQPALRARTAAGRIEVR